MLLGVIVATLPLRPLHFGPAPMSPFLLLIPLAAVGLGEEVLAPGAKPMLHGFATPLMGPVLRPRCCISLALKAHSPAKKAPYTALSWLGDRSYSLYLLHFPIMAFVWFMEISSGSRCGCSTGPSRMGSRRPSSSSLLP